VMMSWPNRISRAGLVVAKRPLGLIVNRKFDDDPEIKETMPNRSGE